MNNTTTTFAINFVLGASTKTLVVKATDRDDAFAVARDVLARNRFYSASLQGSARVASQADIDNAEAL